MKIWALNGAVILALITFLFFATRAAAPTHQEPMPQVVATSTVTASIDERVHGLDVFVTPLKLVSDSRCPEDVQCIWAGTVTVKTKIESGLGTSEMTLELGKPVTTEAEEITLINVSPAKTQAEIPASSYRFEFAVKKR